MAPPNDKKPFYAGQQLDREVVERIVDTADLEKLKSPPGATFEPSQGSPYVASEKHINHLMANQKVFDTISNRLQTFSPKIVLGDHIVYNWDRIVELSKHRFLPVVAHRNVLDGIDFIVEDRDKLIAAIKDAKAGEEAAFRAGSNKGWKDHWALTISFMATDGIGFREIFRPRINDQPLAGMKELPFDTRLGRDVNIDISALHVAIAKFPKLDQDRCNIHVDKLTVTLGGIGDDVQISPSVLSHFVNELLFKTKLQGKLPDWILDTFDFSLLNPDEGFLNAGFVANIINKPHFKWTFNFTVGLNNNVNQEWSGDFRFEKSVGTGIVVQW